MSKPITILTFHFNHNYGAVIQAFALQEFLRTNGYAVSFPAYIPPYMVPCSGLFRGIRSNGRIQPRLVLQKLKSIPRSVKFNRFRQKFLAIDSSANTLEKSVRRQLESEAVIVGSDQVWNLNCFAGESFDGYYFLEALLEKGGSSSRPKRISYAACFGKREQPPAKLARAARLISGFDAVFSRNRLTRDIVEHSARVQVPLVVDPTLLPDVNWPISNRANPRGKYILVYSIAEYQASMAVKILTRLKEVADLPVVQVCSESAHLVPGCQCYESAACPAEWLDLIRDAEYVVTDSFHGCAFALRFGRRFVAYAEDWRAERMQDLLSLFGLGRVLLTCDEHLERIGEIGFFDLDWPSLQARVEALGRESSALLLDALAVPVPNRRLLDQSSG